MNLYFVALELIVGFLNLRKERLAVDLAIEKCNEGVQSGANIQRVDVLSDRVLIKLCADAGLLF